MSTLEELDREAYREMAIEYAEMAAKGYERRIYSCGRMMGWGWFPIPWYKKLWRKWRKKQ